MLNPLGSREDTSLNMDSYNLNPVRCLHSRLQKFFVFVIGSVDFFFRYSLVLNRSRICVLWCDEKRCKQVFHFPACSVGKVQSFQVAIPHLYLQRLKSLIVVDRNKRRKSVFGYFIGHPIPNRGFLLLLPRRKPQKLAGSPKDLKCERKEQQDYIVNFLSCRTILFPPTRFVSDARFIRRFQYLVACVQPPLSSKKSEGGCTQAKY